MFFLVQLCCHFVLFSLTTSAFHISYSFSLFSEVSHTAILGKAFPVLSCESLKNEPILRTRGSWSMGVGKRCFPYKLQKTKDFDCLSFEFGLLRNIKENKAIKCKRYHSCLCRRERKKILGMKMTLR